MINIANINIPPQYISYIERTSRFIHDISNQRIRSRTFQFQLKCSTHMTLIANVVYQFTCSCDTNVTNIVLKVRFFCIWTKNLFHSLLKSAYSAGAFLFETHFCLSGKIVMK